MNEIPFTVVRGPRREVSQRRAGSGVLSSSCDFFDIGLRYVCAMSGAVIVEVW